MPKLIYIYFAWGQEYVIYWVIALGVILGSLGCLFWLKKYVKPVKNKEDFNQYLEKNLKSISLLSQDSQDSEKMMSEIENINKQVDVFRNQIKNMESKINRLDVIAAEKENKIIDKQLIQRGTIYEAFDSGMSITEIAREFNKDKGEIELVLNLRKKHLR